MIIFNLAESQDNEPKVRETNFEIEKVMRIGSRANQPGARPRPTLIKMRNAKEKWDIIGKAKELKHEQNQTRKKLGIIPDLTPKEREAESLTEYYVRN